jgi:hypothetical protein
MPMELGYSRPVSSVCVSPGSPEGEIDPQTVLSLWSTPERLQWIAGVLEWSK